MIINIVAGSDFNYQLLKLHPADITIGVDYGAYQLLERKLSLDYAFGDFDSISEEKLEKLIISGVKINQYQSEKDNTDTELALSFALSLNPEVINLFGVTGKRLDHFLSVIYLFNKVIETNSKMYIYDDYNKIYLLKPGKYKIMKSAYHYISFFAYHNEVNNLTLRNFKYELTNHFLNNHDSLCISNEIIGLTGALEFEQGVLLIVESRD